MRIKFYKPLTEEQAITAIKVMAETYHRNSYVIHFNKFGYFKILMRLRSTDDNVPKLSPCQLRATFKCLEDIWERVNGDPKYVEVKDIHDQIEMVMNLLRMYLKIKE